jgi:penicillin-binding protein 1A
MRLFTSIAVVLVSGAAAVAGLVLLFIALATPQLPEVSALADYRPKVPLRVMTFDGVLIGEFGEERRSVVRLHQVPKSLVDAILAAEDDRFYEHPGIDMLGLARSVGILVATGEKRQGGSTITMQVARNFFLTTEKTYTRKAYELLLSLEIERSLSKNQILELYMNQIYLGRRAYGFASAAQIYFGKPIHRLSIAESAMLAGIPKAPSSFNPIVNPRRAKARQEYILGRMRKLDLISNAQFLEAMKEQIRVVGRPTDFGVDAQYVAEMVRQQVVSLFPEDAYSRGLTVFTTLRASEQRAAQESVREGLLAYDRKQGWRGPEARVALPKEAEALQDVVEEVLAERPDSESLFTAVVTEVASDRVVVMRHNGKTFTIRGEGLKFCEKGLQANASAQQKLSAGAVVRIRPLQTPQEYEITQMPEVQGALIALSTDTGAVRALVGGFDFRQRKFNRVTQAYRQPGSTIKPFVYAAALENGFSGSTLVNDLPIRFDPFVTGGELWEPKNYDEKYEGPMTLRTALAKSKNMVSIRLVQAVGPKQAQAYLTRFGFEAERNPAFFTLALGAGGTTPMQMASAYAVFANGGYRVTPYFIDRIVDENGGLVSRSEPVRAGENAPRVMDERYAFLTDSLLQGVVNQGTAKRALSLGRTDLAGKTGTTNDAQDAWFAGYHPKMVALTWVGYDQPRSLGERETGGGLALPIWMGFMSEALKRLPAAPRVPPKGILRINQEYYTESNQPGVGLDRYQVSNTQAKELSPTGTPLPAAPLPNEGAPPSLPVIEAG